MFSTGFSGLCDHSKTKRLDDDFVRCLKCGQSMISQATQHINKTGQDFTKENKSFERNFNRNFTNIIEEVEQSGPPPIEYYTDMNNFNWMIIDRTLMYNTNPPKFKINFNGDVVVMTNEKIQEILHKIKAVRIDAEQFKYMFKQKKLNNQ